MEESGIAEASDMAEASGIAEASEIEEASGMSDASPPGLTPLPAGGGPCPSPLPSSPGCFVSIPPRGPAGPPLPVAFYKAAVSSKRVERASTW